MQIAVDSVSEVISPVRLTSGWDNLGTLLLTRMSLLGSKPLAGASTRPRRVSMSGVSWFRSLNCSEMSSGKRVPPYTPRDLLSPRMLLVVGALGHQGSHHSPSAHQAAGAALHTGASRAPRLPAPAPRLPLWQSTVMRAQCQLALVAPAAPWLLPMLAKGLSQRSTWSVVTRTKSCFSMSSSPGQAAHRVRVYWFTRRASSSAPARSVTCHRDTSAQWDARRLLPCSPSPSRTSAQNVVVAAGSALIATGLKGWPGSMPCRVMLGLLLALLQDTFTLATRVPGAASSLRATTRGRSGRSGRRPRGLASHPDSATDGLPGCA